MPSAERITDGFSDPVTCDQTEIPGVEILCLDELARLLELISRVAETRLKTEVMPRFPVAIDSPAVGCIVVQDVPVISCERPRPFDAYSQIRKHLPAEPGKDHL